MSQPLAWHAHADSVAITGQAQALTKVLYNRGSCNVQARSLHPFAVHCPLHSLV